MEKKLRKEYFQKMLDGDMKYDVQLADFDCGEGHTITYREWDPETQDYTGRTLDMEIHKCLSTKNHDYWTPEEVAEHGFHVMRLAKKD